MLVFNLLPDLMGDAVKSTGQYFQKCRKIRNLSTYARSGVVSRNEVRELIAEVDAFGGLVRGWLKDHHPEYA